MCGRRTVVWEDFEIFRFPCVWILSKKLPVLGNFPCGGEIDYFRKNPCAGEFSPVLERLIFSGENPCAGEFLAPFSPKKKPLLDILQNSWVVVMNFELA